MAANGMRDEIRAMVREVLQEELQGLRGEGGAHADTSPRPQVREEAVSLTNDAELNAFVHRILELARDGKSVREIAAGRWRFRLHANGGAATAPRPPAAPGSPPTPASVVFDRGLVSERQVAQVPAGSAIQVGKRVRFTPLARDEIRRKGIQVERTGT